MILDYFFYRGYKSLRSQKYDVQDARYYSCRSVVMMLNLLAFPTAWIISAFFGAQGISVGRGVIYLFFLYVDWNFVYGRYGKTKFLIFIEKYSAQEPFRIPTIILGICVLLSFLGGFFVAGLINVLFLEPLNLIGCLGNYL